MKLLTKTLIALLLLVPSTMLSGPRTFGLKLGALASHQTWNYAFISGDVPTVTHWGVDVGCYAEWLSMPVFSISTEVHFAERGTAQEFVETTPQFPEGTGRTVKLGSKVDYLSLPVLAKCRAEFSDGEAYLLAGPRIDIKLGSVDGFSPSVFSHFRDVSIGPTFGAGAVVRHLLAEHALGIEGRYSMSIGPEYSTPLLEIGNSRSVEFLIVVEL